MVLIPKKRRIINVFSHAPGYVASMFSVSTKGQSFRRYLNKLQNLKVNILKINILIIF